MVGAWGGGRKAHSHSPFLVHFALKGSYVAARPPRPTFPRGRAGPALAVIGFARFGIAEPRQVPRLAASVRDSATRFGCLKPTRRDEGSRQEEAQRLGRILRPKPGENQAYFYSIVSRDTVEQDFALKRQLFLCEQGYEYQIITLDQPGDSLP